MKRLAIISLSILGFAGLIAVAFILAAALQPSAKSKAERSQHDITSVGPGQYVIAPFRRSDTRFDEVLIVRDWDNAVHVYLLPTEDGKVILPERWWGMGYHRCADFRPELNDEGRILKGGSITCHDAEFPAWGKSQWEWSLDGKPKSEYGIAMYSPAFEVRDHTVYINR